VSSVVNTFNSGSNEQKWEVLATQQFIAHYGNGMDSYNFYRRTGYPKKLQLNIDPNPGAFVRSFFYPANEANVNSNIVQNQVLMYKYSGILILHHLDSQLLTKK
jgi:hypothetical protein